MHKQKKEYFIQAILFITTIITTTLAGKDWTGNPEFNWENISRGFYFSIPFLTILTVHEFGHYIASKFYKLKVTLPFYIPFYIPGLLSIGTLGAFIRIKSPMKSKREVMDVGIAGPLAGFIVAIGVLFYGFTHLPAKESIYEIHPEYKEYGLNYEKEVYSYKFSRKTDSINYHNLMKENPQLPVWEPQKEYGTFALGKNLMIIFFEKFVASDQKLIPNKYEMFHYPFIFAGFLALFFTALNLLPIGQLDGGHVIYGLLGSKKHQRISTVVFFALIYFGGVGVFKNNLIGNVFGSVENLFMFGPLYLYFLYFVVSKISENWKNNLLIASVIFAAQYFTELIFPDFKGISFLYMVFGLLLGRFLGLGHPPTYIEEELSIGRKILGWISLIIFITCFTPDIFEVITFTK